LLSVREKINEANQVVIIDLHDNGSIMRRPITADSAIMHPTSKIIALKAQRQLQIFNLELKSKLKSHVMNEDVTFWKWVNEKTIGLVTDTAVFHWSIDSDSTSPQKIFDRNTSLQGSQIISYKVNSEDKWMALIGISQQGGRVVGNMQLYSKDRAVSQPIEGHAAAFAEIQLEGAPYKTKLFAFAVRNANAAKVIFHLTYF
jgi:clathrin heavy chain